MHCRSQWYFAHVTTVSLSWRVQNIVVIGPVYSKLERSEFSSNFEFDRNMFSGTGAMTPTLQISMMFSSVSYAKGGCLFYIRKRDWAGRENENIPPIRSFNDVCDLRMLLPNHICPERRWIITWDTKTPQCDKWHWMNKMQSYYIQWDITGGENATDWVCHIFICYYS